MKRAMSMFALLSLVGCGELPGEGDTQTQTETQSVTQAGQPADPVEAAAAAEIPVTPRVQRFSLAPTIALPTGEVRPQAWSNLKQASLREEGADARGHFDPAQVKALEAHRLRAQAATGVVP